MRQFSVWAVLAVSLTAASTRPAIAQGTAPPKNDPATAAAPKTAAEETAPTVRTFVTNANDVLSDLEAVMKLSTPADQKMWPRFLEYFEVFLLGVDRTKITRMDLILDEKIERYRLSVPIELIGGSIATGLSKFRKQNLDGLGIQSRQTANSFYQLSNAFKGFMRFGFGFASIAEKKDDIPLGMANPAIDVAHLIERKYDVAVEGFNKDHGQDERRKMSQLRRADFLATFKRKETETPDEFALRKVFTETQMDEAERIYVEGAYLLLGGIVSGAKDASIDVEMTAIAGTAFEASIKTQGQKPSRWACIERVADPILSARVNFPLDEMRIANIQKITKVMRTTAHNDIDAGKQRSAEEKAAAKKAADLFFDMIDAGAKTGRLDTFFESHSNKSGKNTLIAGAVPADGNAFLEILDLVPKAGQGGKVERDVAEENGVKIHKVTTPLDMREDAKFFFGDEMVYIGVSKELLYLGAGENALEELKAAIRTPADAKATLEARTFIDGFVRLAPWTELLHRRWGKDGDVKSRERALTAFKAGDDVLKLQLTRNDAEAKAGDPPPRPRVTGQMNGLAGVLRYIGAEMAEFTRNIDK